MAKIDELLQLLDQQDARVRRAFLVFADSVRSPEVMDELIRMLEAGDLDGALRIVDSYVANFGNVIPEVMRSVGVATAVELNESVRDIHMAVGFDPTNPRAAQLAADSRMSLIQQLSDQQRLATRQAISRSIGEGAGAQETARAFRDSIGLTVNQEGYVANYRRLLEQRDRRALDRTLRDRRYDDRLRAALERDRPLTQRQIDVMVDRYRARALAMRAETIGRTEALTAYSQARQESLLQMMQQTGLPAERVRRIWHSTHDERVREWHATMEGQRRGVDEPFVDGLGNQLEYPGDPESPGETRINCRCTTSYEVLPAR